MDNPKPEEKKLKDLPVGVAVPDDSAIKGGDRKVLTVPNTGAVQSSQTIQQTTNSGGGNLVGPVPPHPNGGG